MLYLIAPHILFLFVVVVVYMPFCCRRSFVVRCQYIYLFGSQSMNEPRIMLSNKNYLKKSPIVYVSNSIETFVASEHCVSKSIDKFQSDDNN